MVELSPLSRWVVFQGLTAWSSLSFVVLYGNYNRERSTGQVGLVFALFLAIKPEVAIFAVIGVKQWHRETKRCMVLLLNFGNSRHFISLLEERNDDCFESY
jgi:hypothetical protein